MRWILAAGGVVLVLGIYIRERIKRKALEDRERFLRAHSYLPSEDWDSFEETPKSEDNLELPSMYAAKSDREVPESIPVQGNSNSTHRESEDRAAYEENTPFEIIQIKVTAPKGGLFSGDQLLDALSEINLEFGSMDIFHKYAPGSEAPFFSVVNMVEPGTFPVDDTDQFHSPGVVFFLQVALSEQPLVAFDDMIGSVCQLAARLGGEIRDEDNELLSIEKTESIRESLVSVAGWSV